MNQKLKKKIILNIPYVAIGLFATNLGEAWRIADGINASEKLQGLIIGGGFQNAFTNPLPSLHPFDLLIGAACGAALGAVCLLIKILHKWRNKQQALLELKAMAEEMGATDIQVDSEKGTISFVTTSESLDDRKFDEMIRLLSDKGLKIRVSRTKEEKENMPEAKSTDIGYVNKNNQRNNEITSHEGTDNNQYFYEMECLNCGHKYYANGTDIWQRKCPACQGGRS